MSNKTLKLTNILNHVKFETATILNLVFIFDQVMFLVFVVFPEIKPSWNFNEGFYSMQKIKPI